MVVLLWVASLGLSGKISLSIKLLKKSDSFSNLEVETSIIIEVALDIINGEINQHTSDFRSDGIAHQLFNEWIDKLSSHLFVVGVLDEHSGYKLETLLVIVVDLGIGVCQVGGTRRVGNDDLRGLSLSLNSHGLLSDWVHRGHGRSVHVGLSSLGTWSASGSAALAVVLLLDTWGSHGILRAIHGAHISLDDRQDLLDQLDHVGSLKD
jgi:hypothetical protein